MKLFEVTLTKSSTVKINVAADDAETAKGKIVLDVDEAVVNVEEKGDVTV